MSQHSPWQRPTQPQDPLSPRLGLSFKSNMCSFVRNVPRTAQGPTCFGPSPGDFSCHSHSASHPLASQGASKLWPGWGLEIRTRSVGDSGVPPLGPISSLGCCCQVRLAQRDHSCPPTTVHPTAPDMTLGPLYSHHVPHPQGVPPGRPAPRPCLPVQCHPDTRGLRTRHPRRSRQRP